MRISRATFPSTVRNSVQVILPASFAPHNNGCRIAYHLQLLEHNPCGKWLSDHPDSASGCFPPLIKQLWLLCHSTSNASCMKSIWWRISMMMQGTARNAESQPENRDCSSLCTPLWTVPVLLITFTPLLDYFDPSEDRCYFLKNAFAVLHYEVCLPRAPFE